MKIVSEYTTNHSHRLKIKGGSKLDYAYWYGGNEIEMDGNFSAEQLQALVEFLKEKAGERS